MSLAVREEVIRRPCNTLSIGQGPVKGQYVLGHIFLYPSLEEVRHPRVAYLALAGNVARPPSNYPNGMNQSVISPHIRFFGASCHPGDWSQAHQFCLASRSSPPPPLYTA